MKPRVSLLIPCFYAESFVGDAIQCALRQTYGHVEILIAPDDGATYERIRSQFTSPQLRVLHPGNHKKTGAGAARNRAIDAAHGDFFAMLDADDLIPDDYIERMMKVAQDEGAAVANTHYMEDGETVRIPPIHHRSLSLSGFGQLLASIHPLVHRSMEPGFMDGFAEDVLRDGLIFTKCGLVSVVDTHYGLRLRSDSTCGREKGSEYNIQIAYSRLISNILHSPTAVGAQGLTREDRWAFANLFRFRAAVSNLFAKEGKGLSYHAFVKDREASFWDRYCASLRDDDLRIPNLS